MHLINVGLRSQLLSDEIISPLGESLGICRVSQKSQSRVPDRREQFNLCLFSTHHILHSSPADSCINVAPSRSILSLHFHPSAVASLRAALTSSSPAVHDTSHRHHVVFLQDKWPLGSHNLISRIFYEPALPISAIDCWLVVSASTQSSSRRRKAAKLSAMSLALVLDPKTTDKLHGSVSPASQKALREITLWV